MAALSQDCYYPFKQLLVQFGCKQNVWEIGLWQKQNVHYQEKNKEIE